MLHGKGNQAILTKTREEDRQEALEDKTGLTADEIITLEITGSQGGGRTSSDSFVLQQFPFPVDSTIKQKQKLDVRKVRPELGEMSD